MDKPIKLRSDLNCPLCHSEQIRDKLRFKQDSLLLCQDCGFIFSATSKNIDFKKIYTKDYFYGFKGNCGYKDYEGEFAAHEYTFRTRIKHAKKRLNKTGVLLDYGCAYGHLLEVAKQEGWTVFGTDICASAVKRAHQKFKVPVFVSDITRPAVRDHIFDLICLYDVVEHIPLSKEFFEKIHNKLKDGGLFHLTTPNIASLSAHILRRFWYHYKPGEHVSYFSAKTIQETLKKSSFTVDGIHAAPSQMTTKAFLERMKYYWHKGASIFEKILSILNLHNLVINFYIGEMEAWARPYYPDNKVLKNNPIHLTGNHITDLLQILWCPDCHSDLNYNKQTNSLICNHCNLAYRIEDNVPIMLVDEAQRTERLVV